MSGGGGTYEVAYATYLEDTHKHILHMAYDEAALVIHSSPYAGITVPTADDAFFGIGYVITDYPTIHDMFGKFRAGLDIEVLCEQILSEMLNSPAIAAAIAAESAYLDDQIETALGKINAGARNLNAVMTSGFIEAKRKLIRDDKLKIINKFAADLKIEAMKLAIHRWGSHLEWNRNVIDQFLNINHLYWSLKFDQIKFSTAIAAEDKLWALHIVDIIRPVVGVLNGAAAATNKKSGWQDTVANVLGVASAVMKIGPEVAKGGAALLGSLGIA